MIKILETNLYGRDLEIALNCLNKGKLIASKPTKDGEAAYVWRMVAFTISSNPKHHCMPVTAEFDLPECYWPPRNTKYDPAVASLCSERRRKRIKELNVIVEAMINATPKSEWHGVKRWARAFGV